MIHPKIVHHGFLQPHELTPHLIDAAAFVMPSKKEPWGVVLHEMAIAGLPLIASLRVGAASHFLQNCVNGFKIDLASHGVHNALLNLFQLPNDDLLELGEQAHIIAEMKMPADWVRILFTLV